MDLKIHNLQQISQPERITQTPEADGSFRFTLLSNIEESELQRHPRYETVPQIDPGIYERDRQPFTQVQP